MPTDISSASTTTLACFPSPLAHFILPVEVGDMNLTCGQAGGAGSGSRGAQPPDGLAAEAQRLVLTVLVQDVVLAAVPVVVQQLPPAAEQRMSMG